MYVRKRKKKIYVSSSKKAEYRNVYLNSEHWEDVKRRYRESKHPWVCYVCGTTVHLQLHHKTYERIGCEELTDLIPMCKDCHFAVHRYLVKYKNKNMGITLLNAHSRYKNRAI